MGRPKEVMERYFDFDFYYANWGTQRLLDAGRRDEASVWLVDLLGPPTPLR